MKLDLHTPAQLLRWIGSNAKRIAVFVVGVAVLLAGVAMLVLPGPGLLVIIAGLAILATEFVWAERALDQAKARSSSAAGAVSRRLPFRRGESRASALSDPAGDSSRPGSAAVGTAGDPQRN